MIYYGMDSIKSYYRGDRSKEVTVSFLIAIIQQICKKKKNIIKL